MEYSNLIALCVFGYAIAYSVPRVIILIAIEDIVAGTLIQTSVLLILFNSAGTLSKMYSPFLIRKISFLLSIVIISLVWVISYMLLVASDNVVIRLVGVFSYGIGNGLANVLILMLLGYYNEIDKNISAFRLGVGACNLLGVLLYNGLTVWQCFSPRTTIAFLFPLGFLSVVFYGILNHGPLKNYQFSEETYTKQHQSKSNQYLQFALKVFPFASYCFLSLFSYYVAFCSVLTTLTFPSAPFDVRSHYQYYRMAGDIGLLFGGMELMLVTRLFPEWISTFLNRKIWIYILVSVGQVIFFLAASWYRFVPSVYIILLLCGTHGFLMSSINVRAVSSASECFTKSSDRGTAMAITEVGHSMGGLGAGLLGIFVEDYLRQYCVNNLLMGKFCLARFSSPAGWNENLNCF